MKSKFMALALALASVLALAACGDDSTTDTSSTSSSSAAANGVDRAFARSMIPHHRSAVDMARIALEQGESRFVRGLASDIIRSQTAEIATLTDRDRALAERGIEVGSLGVSDDEMGMDHDAKTLDGAEAFDEAFIEMMVPHHRGAVVMARAELAAGGDPELKRLAEQIIAAQQGEIEAMRAHLGMPTSTDDSADPESTDSGGGGHSGH